MDGVIGQIIRRGYHPIGLVARKTIHLINHFIRFGLSAFALAFISKELGHTELVDVGSGDGRIALSTILGLRSISIEIDTNLSVLQHDVISSTGVEFKILNIDATQLTIILSTSNPVFFISGLPEQGDILARDVLTKARIYMTQKSNLALISWGVMC